MLDTPEGGDDPLLEIIRCYRAEVAALNACALAGEANDKELDQWCGRNNAILNSVVGVPALTAAGALAALDLVIEEEDISNHSIFGARMVSLVEAVKGYIASTAT